MLKVTGKVKASLFTAISYNLPYISCFSLLVCSLREESTSKVSICPKMPFLDEIYDHFDSDLMKPFPVKDLFEDCLSKTSIF